MRTLPVDKTTLDINTGQNPFKGNNFITGGMPAEDANAFCDDHFNPPPSGDCSTNTVSDQQELYLIDRNGQYKTIFARKKVKIVDGNPEYALALVKLYGKDENPKDGIYEKWTEISGGAINYYFMPGFSYNPAVGKNLEATLNGTTYDLYEGFVPISPLRTNVTDIHFYISPMEDPRKAFSETKVSDAIQQQPHVTIVMTVTPAASELINYMGTPPEVTLQTTVTSRIYNEVNSYDAQPRCKEKGYS